MKVAKFADSDEETLERLIDKFGLSDFLAHVEEIANEKVEHLSSNWPDERATQWGLSSAKAWSKAANIVDLAALKIRKLGL
jgi:thioester reductase-like protein